MPFVALAVLLVLPHAAFAAGDQVAAPAARGSLIDYLIAFGAGFQTSLTPCVYPMIPITLGIFGARGKGVTRGRALLLATVYIVGMGLTYATLGVVVSLVGGEFGAINSNPYVVFPIVILFCVLAASMFGAFELNLPQSWQNRLNQVGGSGFRGAFAMGLVGGLIAAPCTGPFLLGLLTFVGTSGNVVTGGSLLFVYALGMGVLFWVLAAFAMSLPKSGRWMEWVKSGGGILLLLGAIYFLQPFLPFMRHFAVPAVWFLLASLALIVVGFVLGAIHLSFHAARGEQIRKGAGIALVLAGAFSAWSYTLTPKQHLAFIHDDETAAFARARAEGKGVMVDFAATWCTPCREFELTFGDDEIYRQITDGFVPLQFDVSEDTDADKEHRSRYGAGTLPAIVYLTAEGQVIGRVCHLMEPNQLKPLLTKASQQRTGAIVAAIDPQCDKSGQSGQTDKKK